MSGHSTQNSWTSTHLSPVRAAAAATCRVWFDCTPPIETSVSQPCASASATRYSSFRVLLPPYARPELQSSRFAQISTSPPRCSLSRSSRCTGDGPNSSGTRAKLSKPRCSVTGRVLDVFEGPIRLDPPTHSSPQRRIELRLAPADPRKHARVDGFVRNGVDVDAPDHVAVGREHGVREAGPTFEVRGMPFEIRAILVRRHRTRPRALFPARCGMDVVHRGRPGGVVGLVVLRPERLQHELRCLESTRHDEVRRHEELGSHAPIL